MLACSPNAHGMHGRHVRCAPHARQATPRAPPGGLRMRLGVLRVWPALPSHAHQGLVYMPRMALSIADSSRSGVGSVRHGFRVRGVGGVGGSGGGGGVGNHHKHL